MRVTLLDREGRELTEIASHVGRFPGGMLVDWATRPDALFQYYFDRGGRQVTLVDDEAQYAAVLGTRWQMGTRCWFLHDCHLVRAAPDGRRGRSIQESGLIVADSRHVDGNRNGRGQSVPEMLRTSEAGGVPT